MKVIKSLKNEGIKVRIKIEDAHLLDQYLKENKARSEDFKVTVLKALVHTQDVKKTAEIFMIPEPTIYDWVGEWNKKN